MGYAGGPHRRRHFDEYTTMTATITDLQSVLSEYDYVLVFDASGSMATDDAPGGLTRWDYAKETAISFARDLGKLDEDGLDVVFFGGTRIDSYVGQNASSIGALFEGRRTGGGTPLAKALQEALKLAGKSAKKDMIVVFTDGVPDDEAAAAKVIVDQSNQQQTDDALTILFVQLGRDPAATAYLRRLDDNLRGAKFDIVDSKTIEEVEQFPSTAALIAAAIND